MQFTKRIAKKEVINEGDFGDCLFVVDSGCLECYKKMSDGEEKLVKTYHEGETFGELALLYNCPRAARIMTVEDSRLWKLDRNTFNVIVKDAAV